MLTLGRYSNWSRTDLRRMTMAELESYMEAAGELEDDARERERKAVR